MNQDFERYFDEVSKSKPIQREKAYLDWLKAEYERAKPNPDKKKKRKPKRKPIENKNWTPDMNCLRCSAPGVHLVGFSHQSPRGPAYKATCKKCGRYQKFLSESQAMPYLAAQQQSESESATCDNEAAC